MLFSAIQIAIRTSILAVFSRRTSTNQTTRQAFLLLGAASVLSLLLGAAPVLHAAEPISQASALNPKTYDLNSRKGVLAVYERVQTIAEQHCVASSNLAQALSAKERACRDRILAQLLSKLADPYLSYLHENPEAQRLAKR